MSLSDYKMYPKASLVQKLPEIGGILFGDMPEPIEKAFHPGGEGGFTYRSAVGFKLVSDFPETESEAVGVWNAFRVRKEKKISAYFGKGVAPVLFPSGLTLRSAEKVPVKNASALPISWDRIEGFYWVLTYDLVLNALRLKQNLASLAATHLLGYESPFSQEEITPVLNTFLKKAEKQSFKGVVKGASLKVYVSGNHIIGMDYSLPVMEYGKPSELLKIPDRIQYSGSQSVTEVEDVPDFYFRVQEGLVVPFYMDGVAACREGVGVSFPIRTTGQVLFFNPATPEWGLLLNLPTGLSNIGTNSLIVITRNNIAFDNVALRNQLFLTVDTDTYNGTVQSRVVIDRFILTQLFSDTNNLVLEAHTGNNMLSLLSRKLTQDKYGFGALLCKNQETNGAQAIELSFDDDVGTWFRSPDSSQIADPVNCNLLPTSSDLSEPIPWLAPLRVTGGTGTGSGYTYPLTHSLLGAYYYDRTIVETINSNNQLSRPTLKWSNEPNVVPPNTNSSVNTTWYWVVALQNIYIYSNGTLLHVIRRVDVDVLNKMLAKRDDFTDSNNPDRWFEGYIDRRKLKI